MVTFLQRIILLVIPGHRNADETKTLHRRQLTDAMVTPINADTSEIMKVIINRDFLSENNQPFNSRNY